jgi:hypothetical protein
MKKKNQNQNQTRPYVSNPQTKIGDGPAGFSVIFDPNLKVIVLAFDRAIRWIALTPEMAKTMGNDLIKYSEFKFTERREHESS